MPYEFQSNRIYRMPTHFGPSLGPRQGEDGRRFQNINSPKFTTWSVSFLTNREQLEALLPPGFSLGAEAIVTVGVTYITEIEWLAGRGYNTVGVSFPATFNGKHDHAVGTFLSVLWENCAHCVMTGREDLGFSKIHCDIPEPRIYQGHVRCEASWDGFKFMDLEIRNLKKLASEEIQKTISKQSDDGILHYKYMPKTGEWGKADACYVTLTPADCPNRVVKEIWKGEGTVCFNKATWEDLPTTFNIVNVLHSLEVKEYCDARMVKMVGGKDLRDQRILQ